jgi:hypothetical protein
VIGPEEQKREISLFHLRQRNFPAPLPYQVSINSTLEITSWFDFFSVG